MICFPIFGLGAAGEEFPATELVAAGIVPSRGLNLWRMRHTCGQIRFPRHISLGGVNHARLTSESVTRGVIWRIVQEDCRRMGLRAPQTREDSSDWGEL